jgi:hypothetical protein
MKSIFTEFRTFYPEYLKAHNNKANQVLHFTGASLFFILLILAIAFSNYWFVIAGIITGYALPAIGHRFFQQNESFRTSKPVLCVLCAFRMYINTWQRIFKNPVLSGRN